MGIHLPVLISILLTTLIALLLPLGQCQQQRVVYVSKKSTAVDDYSCWTGGPSRPCSNLTLALGGVYNTSNSIVQIDSGDGPYQLDPSPYSDFRGVRVFKMVGTGEGQVEIECSNGAGLSFFNVTDIAIVNISFIGCGVLHNSTSKNFTISSTLHFQTVNVALYFLGCVGVTLNQVSVNKSNGIAVQFYATFGVIAILGSKFISNPYNAKSGIGGAVYIEFPFCLPDSATECSHVDPQLVSDSNYTIRDCLFVNNSALSNDDNAIFNVPWNENNTQFGKGGGLSISFKGNSKGNKVWILNSNFTSNKAVSGGGIYVDFQDTATNNTVEVTHASVEDCNARLGGAASIRFYDFQGPVTNNTISFISSKFTSNCACVWGGAVSLYMTRMTDSTNNVLLSRSNFTYNNGSFGSAVAFSVWHSSPPGTSAQLAPVVNSCRFAHNKDINAGNSQEVAQFGALYSDHVSVKFEGTVEFLNNSGAGTVAVATQITFTEQTTARFINNTAIRGAAISLLGNAVMIVSPNTSYLFENNEASQLGGAIYADIIGERTPLSRNCFMQYSVFNVPPEKWEVQFTFMNNTVNSSNDGRMPNSIYAPSILPCLGEKRLNIPLDRNITRKVFCWNETAWYYADHSCWQEIQTAVARLDVPSMLQVTAGQDARMNITAWDDLGNNITRYLVLTAMSETTSIFIAQRSHYISSNVIKLHLNDSNEIGKPLHIHLQTLPERVLVSKLNITFKECLAGLKLIEGTCDFHGNYNNYLRFNATTRLAEIFRGYWIGSGKISNDEDVAAFCLYCNGFSSRPNITSGGYIPLDFTNSDNAECLEGKRMGFLCSQCKSNYSTAIFANDLQCKNTSQAYNIGVWTTYVIVHLLYYLILASFIVITNISFTAAPLNAAIIFAQMVSTVVNVNDAGIVPLWGFKPIAKVYTCLYDLFNLNVFHPLFHDLTISVPLPVARFLVGLLPLWTLFVVLLVWVVISIITTQCIQKRCHQCIMRDPNELYWYCWEFQISEATRNTLASFLLLSSTSLLTVLLQLLNPTYLYSSDARIVRAVFFLDPGVPYDTRHYYFWVPLLIIIFILVPTLATIAVCRYRGDKVQKNVPVTPYTLIDHFLEPLQSHFKEYEDGDDLTCLQCVRPTENEECPYDITCRCCRRQSCRADLVVFSFSDFHWVPAAYVILRLVLIVIYNVAWNFMMRCMMQLVTVLVAASLVIIFRPYKREWINFLDTLIFLDLALLIGLSAYQYHLIQVNLTLSEWAYAYQLILIFLPFCWISLYIGIRLVAKIKQCKSTMQSSGNQGNVQVDIQNGERNLLINDEQNAGYRLQNPSYSV